jgi:hypothetical protein
LRAVSLNKCQSHLFCFFDLRAVSSTRIGQLQTQ